MIKFVQAALEADSKTKWFYFQVIIYALAMIISTAYVYLRLDFVRSYDTKKTEQASSK